MFATFPAQPMVVSLQNLGATVDLIDLKKGSSTQINHTHTPNLKAGHIANEGGAAVHFGH